MEMTKAAVNCSVWWRMSSMFIVTLLKEFSGHFKEVLDMNWSCLNALCPPSGLCHVFDALGM